jgi:hypothetical protein
MSDYSDSMAELVQKRAEFGAPWGTSLKLMTAVSAAILLGVASIPLFTGPSGNIFWILIMSVMPLSILFICLLFMIRGYVLTEDTLFVRRLLWNTRVPLSGLQSACVEDSQEFKGTIRTCGNGGMFCFAGWFWNKKLGSFRAFATNSKSIVVLRFPDKTIVVTPLQPDKFISLLSD